MFMLRHIDRRCCSFFLFLFSPDDLEVSGLGWGGMGGWMYVQLEIGERRRWYRWCDVFFALFWLHFFCCCRPTLFSRVCWSFFLFFDSLDPGIYVCLVLARVGKRVSLLGLVTGRCLGGLLFFYVGDDKMIWGGYSSVWKGDGNEWFTTAPWADGLPEQSLGVFRV